MASASNENPKFAKGQRLGCEQCGAEIEVVNPCACEPPDQEFTCCGQAMIPTSGASVNLNVG